MNDAPLLDPDVGELAQRDLLAVRRRDEDVADLLRLAERLLQPHHEVERALALHDLGRRRATDRRFDQPVDVDDVQAVARDLVAIRLDREARLAELLHEGDVR